MKAIYAVLSAAVCLIMVGPAYAGQPPSLKPSHNFVYILGANCAAPCVTLIGRVKREANFGPPGFGETPTIDRKITDYILVLDHALDIKASKYLAPAKGVREVQLFLPFNDNPLATRTGRIEVRGTIENASTAPAVRDYTVMVYSLRILKKRAQTSTTKQNGVRDN